MGYSLRFKMKQYGKMALQHALLPAAYSLGCLLQGRKQRQLIVFADAHHTTLPFSMEPMLEAVNRRNLPVQLHLHNYSDEGTFKSLFHSISFMFLYAKARVVFICDGFLPSASCRKKADTQLIQLWHSCGLLKKMGYSTAEDVPPLYKGHVYANYNLVTVSAPCVVPFLTEGMRQPEGVVRALGVSRTDVYFNEEWNEACKSEFYEAMPQAKGKKVLLWAPTFRGNAGAPTLVGEAPILKLQEQLGADWLVIVKLHPYLERCGRYSEFDALSCSIPTERLLPVTDLLITDYSSTLHDYFFQQRPYVLYAPDAGQYLSKRGSYIDYESIGHYIVADEAQLAATVQRAWAEHDTPEEKAFLRSMLEYHNGACDGHSTERILNEVINSDSHQ